MNLLPVEGRLAGVARRVGAKRPPVERREEAPKVPGRVPDLPLRADIPAVDADLDGAPLDEGPKDVVDLEALGRDAGPGRSWVIVDLEFPDLFGQVVDLEKGDSVAGTRALHKVGDVQVVCMVMKDLSGQDIVVWAEGQLAKARITVGLDPLEHGGKKEPEEADLRDLFGKADDADPAPAAKKKKPEEDEWDDVRTCSPIWDSRSRRYRPWRDVCRHITEETFAD